METTAEKLNGHNMNGYSKGRRGRSAVKMAKGVLPEEARPEAAKDDLSKVKPISIPAISVAVIEVTCVGTSPLIVKAWSKQAREDMLRAQQGLPVVKRRKNPDAEFLGCRYLNKKKQDYLPGHIVKKCLASAGELVGVRRSLLEKTLFVLDDEVIIQSKHGPRKREDMVRNRGRFGAVADIRFRPCFDEWSFTAKVEYNSGFLSPEAILNLFQHAGRSCGLGEWRPQKGGEFGRFRPLKFQKVG